ncbi:MAG: pyridoxal kinase PdxY [Treponema sp.]|nr:pyridoxal kinase PdxY [Treponema sp.]
MAILSIQSHVVYGYAGNTAAVFPMQRLGHSVWAINTVEFSNHTGYGVWRGKVLEAELVKELVLGLEERGALRDCDALLSGYLGDAATGRIIIDTVKKVRKYSPSALYACDPVMGDTGRGFYVKPEIAQIIKDELVPLADIVCPNQFELQVLTGINIENIKDALKAVNKLHETGPSVVLVTSFREKQKNDIEGEIPQLGMIASMRKSVSDTAAIMCKTTTPELPLGGDIAGTGDMTTAVFLSRYLETKNIIKTLELCTASVYSILEASYKTASQEYLKPIELKIIKNQEQFVTPLRFFKAEKII